MRGLILVFGGLAACGGGGGGGGEGSLVLSFEFSGDRYDIGRVTGQAAGGDGWSDEIDVADLGSPLGFFDLEPGTYTVDVTGEVLDGTNSWSSCSGSCSASGEFEVDKGEMTTGTLLWDCDVDCDQTYYCFTAGTPVRTPHGDVSIEALRPGDRVLAVDERTGRVHVRPVVANGRRMVRDRLDVAVAGEVIEVTQEHPFWLPEVGRWVEAGELLPGDLLSRPASWQGDARVTDVSTVPGRVEVFNLSVGGLENTYLAHGVLVHNKSYTFYRDARLGGPQATVTGEDVASDGSGGTWILGTLDGETTTGLTLNTADADHVLMSFDSRRGLDRGLTWGAVGVDKGGRVAGRETGPVVAHVYEAPVDLGHLGGPVLTPDVDNGMALLAFDSALDLEWTAELKGTGRVGLGELEVSRYDTESVLVCGDVAGGDVDLDPGPGIALVEGTEQQGWVAAYGGTDGSLVWHGATEALAAGGQVQIAALAHDRGADGVYIAGRFTGEVDLDPGAGVFAEDSPGGWSGFVVKLDTGGGFIWGAVFDGSDVHLTSVNSAYQGAVIEVGGHFTGEVNADPMYAYAVQSGGGLDGLRLVLSETDGSLVQAAPISSPDDVWVDHVLAAQRWTESQVFGAYSGVLDAAYALPVAPSPETPFRAVFDSQDQVMVSTAADMDVGGVHYDEQVISVGTVMPEHQGYGWPAQGPSDLHMEIIW